MKPTCSIIIPTFNNPQYLNPCIESIKRTGALDGLCELIIVNNGKQPIADFVKGWPNTRVLESGKNLGWEGGLKFGLEHSEAEFVCFQNDDTLIPKATQTFYSQMLWPFQNRNVAAVGPATTIAAGWHSIFQQNAVRSMLEVPYLIFFTVMIRRDDYDAVGGIDTTCPGGDDIDLSIRLRQIGKSILVNPDAFLIHHAFKTGERVRGPADKPGGWNSKEMSDKTTQWLIQKHGFKTYLETMRGFDYQFMPGEDTEGQMVAELVREPKVIELGCGFRKTVPQAIGIDTTPKGERCNHIDGLSVADIVADVTQPLPLNEMSCDTMIARHILEHCVDTLSVLQNWNLPLKIGGRMIIAVPDQRMRNTIPLNPEHVHAFTPESLSTAMKFCGFKEVEIRDPHNGISFVACYEKLFHYPLIEKFMHKSFLIEEPIDA